MGPSPIPHPSPADSNAPPLCTFWIMTMHPSFADDDVYPARRRRIFGMMWIDPEEEVLQPMDKVNAEKYHCRDRRHIRDRAGRGPAARRRGRAGDRDRPLAGALPGRAGTAARPASGGHCALPDGRPLAPGRRARRSGKGARGARRRGDQPTGRIAQQCRRSLPPADIHAGRHRIPMGAQPPGPVPAHARTASAPLGRALRAGGHGQLGLALWRPAGLERSADAPAIQRPGPPTAGPNWRTCSSPPN